MIEPSNMSAPAPQAALSLGHARAHRGAPTTARRAAPAPQAALSMGHTRAHGGAPTTARRAVQCLTMSVLALFFLGSAVSLILWLSLHPRLPTVRVESLSVSGFNLSTSQLTATYSIQLNVTNPNRKIDLQIDDLDLSVLYMDIPLSGNVTGFSPHLQILKNHNSEVKLKMETDRPNQKLRKRTVGNLGGDWSKGVVNFIVKMRAEVKFRARGWLTQQKELSVVCKNLNVEFASAKGKDTGRLLDGRKTCTVNFE